MTTPLQKAAQALIEQHLPTYLDQHIAGLRKALDAEIAQSVEPYAVFHGLVDSGEHGAFNLDLLKMIPRGAYLYLHPPQQAKQAPMTDEQIRALVRDKMGVSPLGYDLTFARAIEAHHGIGGEA